MDEVLFSYRWHAANTIKQIERMKDFAQKTQRYELTFLEKNVDFDLKILDLIKKGVLYRSQGIPSFFEVLTYRRCGKKRKEIKLFNKIIFSYIK